MKYFCSLITLLFCLSCLTTFETTAKKAHQDSTTESFEKSLAEQKSKFKERDSYASSRAWVDQAAGLPAESASTNNSNEFNYGDESVNDAPTKGFQPMVIIVFTLLSLILFVGVMVWSIFTVKDKKKSLSQSSTIQEKSNFKLLDSLDLENGKALYLIELLERQFLIASAWGSISLITEIQENLFPKKKKIELSKEIQSSLDFMTLKGENLQNDLTENLYEKEKEESATSPTWLQSINEEDEVQTTRPLKNTIKRIINENQEKNKTSDKSMNTYFKAVNTEKVQANTNLEDEIYNNDKFPESEEIEAAKKSADNASYGQIKRSYAENSRNTDTLSNFKRPSWLKDRETKRNQTTEEMKQSSLFSKISQERSAAAFARPIVGENSINKVTEIPPIETITPKVKESHNENENTTSKVSASVGATKITRKISIVEE